MKGFRLSRIAEVDLHVIFLQGLDLFGRRQAAIYAEELETRFNLLTEYPMLGRDISHIAPGLRSYPYEAHIIVYRSDPDDSIRILRIRHARENWMADPLGDR